MHTQYPNRIEATLLFDARFDALDAAVRDFARIAEMKSGDLYSIREHHPDTFARLHHSGDDLTLIFERRDGPPHADLCASALRSPITTILSPDVEHRVERARCHVRLEAAHDALNATPDAFLRRCFFHYIKFPDEATMQRIVDVHFPDLKKDLLREALTRFFEVRETPGLKKKPSTSELLDWIKLLLAEDLPADALKSQDSRKAIPPLYGALLKNEQDVHLFERLVFLDRSQRN